MSTISSAFIGSESSEVKKNNRRRSLARVMYSMRDTKLASFDIFDTLLLRPFSDPKNLFYILGEKFNEMDFYNLRIRCEREARDIKERQYGNREINIYDIYRRVEYYTGINAEYGAHVEFETEMDLIYTNEYQKYILNTFVNNKIPVVLTSDMYYPAEMLEQILHKNGIGGYQNIYVSCDRECSKQEGRLFDCLVKDYPEFPLNLITHIDDNWDVVLKARKKGITAIHYPRNIALTNQYRPKYMSDMVGSAYKGIIGNYLAADETVYSVPYEYGFIYGGFLVLGYCSYIHEICLKEKIEKVLFMSRDGDIMKQVWEFMYGDIPCDYLLISRACVMRLSADIWKKMFIESAVDRMSTKKTVMTVEQILEYCELSDLEYDLQKYGLALDTKISARENPETVSIFRDFMENHIEDIRTQYRESNIIYEKYLENMILSVDQKIALVDIGWRGVNGTTISKEIKKLRPELSTINFIVGGRQSVNLPQVRSGDIRCFLFSAEKNYGALEKHSEKTNFYYELLTMSATPSFKYFYYDNQDRIKIKSSSLTPVNYETVIEIQRGILDFVKEYTFHFRKYPRYYNIPADDVAQVLYNVMSRDEYFMNFFSRLNYSPEIGNDETRFGEWI